ncbi:MAG: hypothetical protein ACOVKO_02080 [Elstera sp.]
MSVFRPIPDGDPAQPPTVAKEARAAGLEPQAGLLPVAETAQPFGHSGVPFWPKGATATYRAKRRPR